jgi:hypothetical protein
MTLTFDDAVPADADADLLAGQTTQAAPTIRVQITLEVVLYVALAVLSLTLRLVQLEHAPLGDAEAHQSLAALRAVNPNVAGKALVAHSPLTFVFNAASFALLPPSDGLARLPVALAGVLLTLSPVLWRRYLNALPPLIISLLLTISPVELLASRTSSPVIWTMLLAVIGPWLVLHYAETHAPAWGIAATMAVAAMVLLAEPAGFLTLLALAFGVGFAWLTEDDPDSNVIPAIRGLIREWPWMNGALAAGLMVFLVGTGLFWLPSGLTTVGSALWTGVRGFVDRTSDAPVAFPLWIGLRYETGLLIFGLIASYRALREGGFFERALVGWTLVGVVWSLVYAGADAAHALWLTVPLAVLVGLMVTNWITERANVAWEVPAWGMPLHAVVTLALWLAVAVSLVLFGKRLLYDLPFEATDLGSFIRTIFSGVYSHNTDFQQAASVEIQKGVFTYDYVLGSIQQRLLVTLLVTLVNGVLFFLVGSLWSARTAWRGFALGTLSALVLFSLGLGGRTALAASGDPRELWYVDPVTNAVHDLRATLREMSLRDTGNPHLTTITALVPEDGALAWALRDYPRTEYVHGVGPETSTAIVLMPVVEPQPAMGADYIGRTLVIRQAWSVETLSWRDALMWFYRDDSRVKPTAGDQWRLWVRKDVYGVEQVPGE